MASRGRGRGLISDYSQEGPRNKKKTLKVLQSLDELSGYLHSLNESNIHIHGAEFAGMVLTFATNEKKLVDTVHLIFDTTTASRDYSNLGSEVCRLIINYDQLDDKITLQQNFLRMLITRCNTEIKKMEEIRNRSIEEWLGIFAFLCELYQKIEVNGEPIRVLGKKGVLDNIENMLNRADIIDDEIDCICAKLKVCGKRLEQQYPDEFEAILVSLRKHIIAHTSSCQRRCIIMELIEFKQLGWSDPTGSLVRFYSDAIADAVVEDEVNREQLDNR